MSKTATAYEVAVQREMLAAARETGRLQTVIDRARIKLETVILPALDGWRRQEAIALIEQLAAADTARPASMRERS